jgi:serine/threonine protein kinase
MPHRRAAVGLPPLPKPQVPPARPSGTRPRTPLRDEPPSVGELIADRYVVERIVAEGGFGVIVAAKHIELEETVAIKFLKAEFANVPDVVGRFAREAKASALIKSEHTPIVYDVGVTSERGPYIVMEYLEGQDLLSLVRERGPLPVEYAVELVLQACEALVAAHARGVVHRDIKPENLFLVRRPHSPELLKVLDFGVSKAALTGNVFGTALSMLKTQNLVGTPLYMSPEQLRGQHDVGPQSDIWSIGAVLYELLTSQTAFRGSSVTEVCANVLECEPEPPASIREDLPADLAAVVMRCLEKKSEARFAGVAELAVALGPFAPPGVRASVERTRAIAKSAGLPGGDAVIATTGGDAAVPGLIATADPVDVAIDVAPAQASSSNASSSNEEAAPSSDNARNLAIVAVILALAAVVIAFVARQPPPTEPTAAAQPPAAATANATAIATATDDGVVSTPIVRLPAAAPPPRPLAPVATVETVPAAAPPTAADEAETHDPTVRPAPRGIIDLPE